MTSGPDAVKVGDGEGWNLDNNPQAQKILQRLEQQGVVAAYFSGHTSMCPTRQYREGQLRNPGLWMFSVTPFRRYAMFEEF